MAKTLILSCREMERSYCYDFTLTLLSKCYGNSVIVGYYILPPSYKKYMSIGQGIIDDCSAHDPKGSKEHG
jgi:hypothetical protein